MPKFIIANWKSNKNSEEAKNWIAEYATAGHGSQATVVLAPAFTLLDVVADEIKKTEAHISLAVQTLSPYPAGSYTGGVSVRNLEGLPIRYAILGHSERRQYFHETNNDVAKQVDQALAAGITPIVCVDKDYITSQAAAIADEVKARCIIAYEPASMIGSGVSEDVGTVTEVLEKVKKVFGPVPVIYGGSVNETNVASYLTVADGVLVGTASLDVEKFKNLISAVA